MSDYTLRFGNTNNAIALGEEPSDFGNNPTSRPSRLRTRSAWNQIDSSGSRLPILDGCSVRRRVGPYKDKSQEELRWDYQRQHDQGAASSLTCSGPLTTIAFGFGSCYGLVVTPIAFGFCSCSGVEAFSFGSCSEHSKPPKCFGFGSCAGCSTLTRAGPLTSKAFSFGTCAGPSPHKAFSFGTSAGPSEPKAFGFGTSSGPSAHKALGCVFPTARVVEWPGRQGP